jgi:hypothetical protein
MRLCLESGGNSPAAFSERFDLRLIELCPKVGDGLIRRRFEVDLKSKFFGWIHIGLRGQPVFFLYDFKGSLPY